jgi:hypothetical protein
LGAPHWKLVAVEIRWRPWSRNFNGGGNPYGTSFVTEGGIHGGPDAHTLTVARAQGRRLAQVASAVALAARQGRLDSGSGVLREPRISELVNSDGRAPQSSDSYDQ